MKATNHKTLTTRIKHTLLAHCGYGQIDVPASLEILRSWLPVHVGVSTVAAVKKAIVFLETGVPQWSVFMREGNGKLPFTAFSALPGQAFCPGAGSVESDGCLAWCYSTKAWRYPDAFLRQWQNTILLQTAAGRAHIAEQFAACDAGTLRLYVDGDFDSMGTLKFWQALLATRPDIDAYGYSKSFELLLAYDKTHAWPLNYALNLSSGHNSDPATAEKIRGLECYRGDFVAVHLPPGTPKPVKGRFATAADEVAYHRAVREAARHAGLGKVFSCPLLCGDCAKKHVCGDKNVGITVATGNHA